MDRLENVTPRNIDPVVPFSAIPRHKFISRDKYDFAVLSISPGYTPEMADALIPVIQEYFREIL